jgi:hypothetical protein
MFLESEINIRFGPNLDKKMIHGPLQPGEGGEHLHNDKIKIVSKILNLVLKIGVKFV